MNLTALSNLWAIDPQALERMRAVLRTAPAEVRAEAFVAPSLATEIAGNVAVIPVRGVLVRRTTWMSQLFDEVGMEEVTAAVNAAAGNSAVRSIVLRIDSPGGNSDGITELADAVFAAREQKRVIAQIEGTATSGAYWLASQATEIWAQRMDVIGSIGARMMIMFDASEAMERDGVKPVQIDTGEFKSAGELGLPISDTQVAEFQKFVDTIFADFQAAIKRGRGISQAVLSPLADGRVWFAKEAKSLGLIDGIRSLSDTMGKAEGRRRNRPSAEEAVPDVELKEYEAGVQEREGWTKEIEALRQIV